MKFNPNDYETVKSRKARFYKDYPDGRIIVKNTTPSELLLDLAIFKVEIYLNKEEQELNLAKATGTALEIRDKEKALNRYGKEYESVNYTSWTENCEESAVGRALDNAGYSGNKKCSREEIEKVNRMSKTLENKVYLLNKEEIDSIMATKTNEELKKVCKDLRKEKGENFLNPISTLYNLRNAQIEKEMEDAIDDVLKI